MLYCVVVLCDRTVIEVGRVCSMCSKWDVSIAALCTRVVRSKWDVTSVVLCDRVVFPCCVIEVGRA